MDDITVTLDNGAVATFDDFEDGTLGNWEIGFAQGAGDFCALRMGLDDLDPSRINLSPQVTFIDDGIVVPGTGPTMCSDWCYGPGGYTVPTYGGLIIDRYNKLHNAVVSPVMPFPPDKDGCLFSFDVYVHEILDSDSPMIFYTWKIRSTPSTNPQDIETQDWIDQGYLGWGQPEYRREVNNVSDLVQPGSCFVQVRLAAFQLEYPKANEGYDGYPAPYFDNVRVEAFTLGESTAVPQAGGIFSVASFPNPFNPITRIEFNLPGRGPLSLKVFNLRGELVRTLVDELRPAGPGFAIWNGTDESGAWVSSGPYFYVIKAGKESRTGKMILLK